MPLTNLQHESRGLRVKRKNGQQQHIKSTEKDCTHASCKPCCSNAENGSGSRTNMRLRRASKPATAATAAIRTKYDKRNKCCCTEKSRIQVQSGTQPLQPAMCVLGNNNSNRNTDCNSNRLRPTLWSTTNVDIKLVFGRRRQVDEVQH